MLKHQIRKRNTCVIVHDWRSCDDTLPLEGDQIHVWRIKRPLERGEIDLLMSFLSQDEVARAQRFRFAEDQDRYVISRGALRAQLANYLGFDPRNLTFSYSERGKPELASDFRDSDLRFNLAHSGEMIGYAFVYRRRIGIDVEKIPLDFPVHEIAARFFSEAERKALSRLPLPQRHAGFFRCWTRKEAYLKATGDGLSLPLSDFDVSLEPELPARLIATRPEQGEASKWQMESLDFGPNYAGALVVEAA